MTIELQPVASNRTSWKQAGFSVLEGLIVVAVISVLAGVVIPSVYSEFEKARLSSCLSELGGMQAVAFDLGDGRYIPTPDEFWNEGYPSSTEGEYYYIVDAEDHNKGHGNDLDNCDEDNPGSSIDGRDCWDLKFVVLCNHDHGQLGQYCYGVDGQPPTILKVDETDPGYKAWLVQNNNDGSAKKGKNPKSAKQ